MLGLASVKPILCGNDIAVGCIIHKLTNLILVRKNTHERMKDTKTGS